MSQTCKFCGKSTQHDEACPTCQQLGETTLLTEVTEDETELLLKPIAQQEEGNPTTRMIEQPPSPQKNRIPLLLIALLILSVVAYGGYTLMNSPALENEQAEQDVELEKTAVQEIPKELQPYEHTSLLHPSLYQDMMLHIHGQKLILGQTSPEEAKAILGEMNYEEHTSGDEYYLIYQDVHQLHDVFLDFKRSTLVRIALTTRASNPIEVSTGHGVHLGAPFAEVLNTYGERYLSSSTVGERYEYMDLHSKLFIIMENVPDFEGGILNYLFLEKYDLAKPYAIDTFEKERIDMEMKVSTSN